MLRAPDLAREIVARGHEAAAHGQSWSMQYDLAEADELRFISDNIDSIRNVTGETPSGYNAPAMRRSPNTLRLLSELGFLYHIDDVSRDEPFIADIGGKDFAVVPYTVSQNDIVQFERYGFDTTAFERQLHDEFEVLYEEAAYRRRLMSISLHDRIAGRPARVKSLERFLRAVLRRRGVAFLRKDQIARIALETADTPRAAVSYW